MNDVNTYAGVAFSQRPEAANFYRDLGHMTPLVATFYSSVRRISSNADEINQVGNIHTLAQLRAQTVTAAHRYRIGHYLSIVPDIRLWIYIVLNANELQTEAVQNEMMRRIRITIEVPAHAADAIDYQSVEDVLGVVDYSPKERTTLRNLARKLLLHLPENKPGLTKNVLTVPRNIVMAEYSLNQQLFRGRQADIYEFIKRKKMYSGIHVPREPRCVHCSGEHRSAECERKYEKHCVNRQQNHKAFDHTCPLFLEYINKFSLAPRTPKTFAQASKLLSTQSHVNTSIIKKQATDKRQSFEIDPYKEKNQNTIEEEKYENLNNIKNQNDIIIQLKDTIVKLTVKSENLELALNEQRIGPVQKDTDRVYKEGSLEYLSISNNKEKMIKKQHVKIPQKIRIKHQNTIRRK
ncbi:hypothetical protein GJ496_004594 [Pomphorhynchus laevis]|nr:hypothetical protein GJ496_004594 [Pomphorhynchus laevis]